MKDPKVIAEEILRDCLEMQVSTADIPSAYEMAKLNAQYCAVTVKWTHPQGSLKHKLYEQVKQELEKM